MLSRCPWFSRSHLMIVAAVGVLACSGNDVPPPLGTGGSSGGGGQTGSGGRAGTGGNAGSGGNAGAGGAGTPGSGGSAGNGGSAGADGSAGAGGQSGRDGGGQPDGLPNGDASSDTRPGDGSADRPNDTPADRPADASAPDGMSTGPSLDACFAGLRPPSRPLRDQVGNKQTADGRYRTRLAIEYIEGQIGTSGTTPLQAFRFAIETPEGTVCVDQEAVLKSAYKITRHNCADSFDLTFNGRRYLITSPAVDPELPKAQLTIFQGTTVVVGPVVLEAGACTTSDTRGCHVAGGCQ